MSKVNERKLNISVPLGIYNTVVAVKKTFENTGQKMTISDVINYMLIDYIKIQQNVVNGKNKQESEENK